MDSGESSEDDYATSSRGAINLEPHVVIVEKSDTGFGFNVRGQVSEGGQLRSINGQLYAPLQHVSAVLRFGAAEKAGLLKGDRILEVNNVVVEGATHKQVVDLIKAGSDRLTLTVISVHPSDIDHLDGGAPVALGAACSSAPCHDESPSSGGGSGYYAAPIYDYSEKRSLPITVPSFQWVSMGGERFVVYNIYMAGRHLCSRRYNVFSQLHDLLKREFCDFQFPKFPGKWPFALNEQQIDARRRVLELYVEKVCAVRVIAESDIMQEFLMDHQNVEANVIDVDLKIMLPDQSILTVIIKKINTADQVYNILRRKLKISDEMAQHYALFEMIDTGYDRKIRSDELPHTLYIQNYSSAAATCILLKKWLFNLDRESMLCNRDAFFKETCYYEAIHAVNAGKVNTGDRMYHLKALQNAMKIDEYLLTVRTMPGYGDIVFPHCQCDARKEGHIVASIGQRYFTIRACDGEGAAEDNVPELNIDWSEILRYALDPDCFLFEYARRGKKPRVVKVFTPFAPFMFDCFETIQLEQQQNSGNTKNGHAEKLNCTVTDDIAV